MSTDQDGDNHLLTEIERIGRLVSDLTALLRTQRDMLRQRGISLPPGTISSLKTVSDELSTISNALKGAQAELEQLRAVAETTALINSTLEVDEVLKTVIDTVIELTGAERGYIMLRNEANGDMEFRIARGLDQQSLDRSDTIISKTIVLRVAETGEPVVTTNAQEDDRFSAQESVVGFSLRSILCVPLRVRGETIGVAYADNRIREGLFAERELELLSAFGNQAAVAIQNARLFENLQRSLTEITELTELLDDVFASIASGVITTDIENIVSLCNHAARHILNISEQESTGVPLRQILPLDGGFETLMQAVRTEGRRDTLEVDPIIPPRDTVNLTLRISPLRDSDDITQGVAIVMDDMTEIKKQEAQIAAVKRYLPPAMVDNIQDLEALALGGVRREITTLFANVIPFEVLLSPTNTDRFMVLLNRYLTVATDAIHEQEGVVDKYMGTDVMSLFNTQLNPTKDHAWRAVSAALNIMRELSQLQETLFDELEQEENRLYCRIGIHTGAATVGNVGSLARREFTAIGDAVNVAKRLEENTHLGQAIISEDTYRACHAELDLFSDAIDVIKRDPIRVKGREQLIPIYEVRYR